MTLRVADGGHKGISNAVFMQTQKNGKMKNVLTRIESDIKKIGNSLTTGPTMQALKELISHTKKSLINNDVSPEHAYKLIDDALTTLRAKVLSPTIQKHLTTIQMVFKNKSDEVLKEPKGTGVRPIIEDIYHS